MTWALPVLPVYVAELVLSGIYVAVSVLVPDGNDPAWMVTMALPPLSKVAVDE